MSPYQYKMGTTVGRNKGMCDCGILHPKALSYVHTLSFSILSSFPNNAIESCQLCQRVESRDSISRVPTSQVVEAKAQCVGIESVVVLVWSCHGKISLQQCQRR